MSRRAADVNAAIKFGSLDLLKSAVADKSNLRFLLQKENLLHVACSFAHLQIVKELVENGALVDQKSFSSQRTPLHEACIAGSPSIVQFLLTKTKKVNEVDELHYTPAHYCAWHGEVECLQLLNEAGASLTVIDSKGFQPAHLAAKQGHDQILDLLRKLGIDLNCQTNDTLRTPIHLAAQFGRTECVKNLLINGCDVTVVDEKGYMPIHLAIITDHLDCVRFLHKQGVALDIPCSGGGRLGVHLAALNGSVKTLHWILDNNSNMDINVVDVAGNGIGHYACERGQAECYNCFLQHMGSPFVKNKADQTPEDIARKFGHPVRMEKAVRNEISCPYCHQLQVRRTWDVNHKLPTGKEAMIQNATGLYRSPLGKYSPKKTAFQGDEYTRSTKLLNTSNDQPRDPILKFYGINFDKI